MMYKQPHSHSDIILGYFFEYMRMYSHPEKSFADADINLSLMLMSRVYEFICVARAAHLFLIVARVVAVEIAALSLLSCVIIN